MHELKKLLYTPAPILQIKKYNANLKHQFSVSFIMRRNKLFG